MAYAGDLKSPDAYASCGFDPHPGHHGYAEHSRDISVDSAHPGPRRQPLSCLQMPVISRTTPPSVLSSSGGRPVWSKRSLAQARLLLVTSNVVEQSVFR
jgi:hypothetical protein